MLYVKVTPKLSTHDTVPGLLADPPSILRDSRGTEAHDRKNEAESAYVSHFSE